MSDALFILFCLSGLGLSFGSAMILLWWTLEEIFGEVK